MAAGLLSERWTDLSLTAIDNYMSDWFCETGKHITEFAIPFEQCLKCDFLGAFYQSVQTIGERSAGGSYFTPPELLQDIVVSENSSVYDPCCGSGGILMSVLSKDHKPELVYGSDINPLAVKICKVNLVLHFMNPDAAPNLFVRDIIVDDNIDRTFDLIVTNPPWGALLSNAQKDSAKKRFPELRSGESFSFALADSMGRLSENGKLVFFLPQSFVNVRTHMDIRQIVCDRTGSIKVKELGNAFRGVMSKAVRVEAEKRTIGDGMFVPPDFFIQSGRTIIDEEIVNAVYQREHITLKGKAKFALGIVTGNNALHVKNDMEVGLEPVFRGRDVFAGGFKKPTFYIKFGPKMFQQVADESLYRQKKIVYRFISERPVCAIDYEGRLLLNSANLFIPDANYPWETIVGLLNSKLYAFLYRKLFASRKVLRSHLEEMPFPHMTSAEHCLFQTTKTDIDRNMQIYRFFGLDAKQIEYINL